MPASARKVTADEFTADAWDMILDALGSGVVNPAEVLEMVYYAAERDLVEATRLFASLGPEDRAKTIELARSLRVGKPNSRATH